MTAMRLSLSANQPVNMDSSEEPISSRLSDPDLTKRKKKKKKKKEKRKRSDSCSTDASSCSTKPRKHKHKKKKKKEKKDKKDKKKDKKDKKETPAPTPRINPIFLRTHNDVNNTIVTVICEDYDYRNRIKLLKITGGWKAVPRTEANEKWSSWDMLVKKNPPTTEQVENSQDEEADEEQDEDEAIELDQDEDLDKTDNPNDELVKPSVPPSLEIAEIPDTDSDVEEVPYVVDKTPVAIVDLCSDDENSRKQLIQEIENQEEKPTEIEVSIPAEKEKCLEINTEPHVDENHNDFENVRAPCELEDTFGRDTDDSVDKRFEFLFNELEKSGIGNVMDQKSISDPAQKTSDQWYGSATLMDELEEMYEGILTERLKIDEPHNKDVLRDIYTFVPTPVEEPSPIDHEQEEKLEQPEDKPIEQESITETENVSKSLEDSPMNLVVQENNNSLGLKDVQEPRLNSSELESLDILWRLPEGTTIHHSKAHEIPNVKPAHQHTPPNPDKGNAIITLVPPPCVKEQCPTPVQEEPLNLGIPKPHPKVDPTPPPPALTPHCKHEEPVRSTNKISLKKIKNDKCSESKLMELLNTKDEKCDPLAQLKEILNDPDVSVPDPLLVPKERLQALIANPAKEIPKLLMKSHQPKVPVLDADLLVVSLAHLQHILQNGEGKETDPKLLQQAQLLQSQLGSDKSGIDAAVLNQMLWLPYLSKLDLNRTPNPQDLLAVMMGYNYPWQQQPIRPQNPTNYEYPHNPHHAAMMQQWHAYGQKNVQLPNPGVVPKAYNDLYKTHQSLGYNVPQMRPPTPSIPSHGSHRAESHQRRVSKHSRHHHHQQQQQHHHNQFRTHDSWIPQTSESSRLPQLHNQPNFPPHPAQQLLQSHQMTQEVKHPNTSMHLSQPPPCLTQAQIRPRLKVKDHLVDPNLRPKLLKYDDPQFPPPGAKFNDQHPSLWHPLFSSQEAGKTYTSPWQWTTPVTVSGE